jgi:hypothetical protein
MPSNSNLIGKIINFSVNYLIDNKKGNAYGNINILNSNEYTIYACWNVFDEDKNSIAGKSRKFFVKQLTDDEILTKIVDDITNYRIRRKKIFNNLVIDTAS